MSAAEGREGTPVLTPDNSVEFRVHCFSCGTEYDQRIPRQEAAWVRPSYLPLIRQCGLCGSDYMGFARKPGQ